MSEALVAMARARRARGLSRAQPGHGLALCRGARAAPARSAHRLAVAPADRAGTCPVGRGCRGRVRMGRASSSMRASSASAPASLLIGWALYHWRYGHRHRVRFGMQAGLLGLARVVVPDGHRARRGSHAVAGTDAAVPFRFQRCRRGQSRIYRLPRHRAAYCCHAGSYGGCCRRRLRVGRIGGPATRLAERRSHLDARPLSSGVLLLASAVW